MKFHRGHKIRFNYKSRNVTGMRWGKRFQSGSGNGRAADPGIWHLHFNSSSAFFRYSKSHDPRRTIQKQRQRTTRGRTSSNFRAVLRFFAAAFFANCASGYRFVVCFVPFFVKN